MHKMREKVAYLEGMSKGLGIDSQSSEGKMLWNVIDVLGDMADEIDDLQRDHYDLEDYVENIDADLAAMEDDVYEDETADETDLVEVECPSCHETVTFEARFLDDADAPQITCPNCGEIVYDAALAIPVISDDKKKISDYDQDPGI